MTEAERPQAYMDERALAAGHTMVRWTNDDEEFSLPPRVGPLSLTDIGAGAVICGPGTSLTVAPGYLRLHANSIVGTGKLVEISLPWTVTDIAPDFYAGPRNRALRLTIHRHLSRRAFDDLLRSAFHLENGLYLCDMPEGAEWTALRSAASCCLPLLPPLRASMRALFSLSPSNASVFDRLLCADLAGRHDAVEEHTVVMEMIAENQTGWHVPEAERQSDLRVRANGALRKYGPFTALFLKPFESADLPRGGKDACLELMRLPAVFTPALRPVRLNGQQYWLYSRNHLCPDVRCPYEREDVGVFARDGLVTDRALSEAVYAKARMLMLL